MTHNFISASQGSDAFASISDVFGSFFNDTIIGNGDQNFLEGRGGDDKITVLNDNFFRVFGDEGTDRLIIGGSGVAISHQDVFDKIFSIEQIDLTGTGNNSLTLTAQDVLEVSDNGRDADLGKRRGFRLVRRPRLDQGN